MDKKYQDIKVNIGSQRILTIRQIELINLIKESDSIKIKYFTDKEYTILIPILPYMEIIID